MPSPSRKNQPKQQPEPEIKEEVLDPELEQEDDTEEESEINIRIATFDDEDEDVVLDPLAGNMAGEVELPSHNIPEWRKNRLLPTNELGLTYDENQDHCFHLNATWKGGCCTILGNAGCQYLGGNQPKCPHFVHRSTETARRAGLPDRERYEMHNVQS